jgi:hypothetical protein
LLCLTVMVLAVICGSAWALEDTYNTLYGIGAGASSSLGPMVQATFIGVNAGHANTTGSVNTFIGASAGYTNTTGTYNTFIGSGAGKVSNTNGNTLIGYCSGFTNSTGSGNTFIGTSSGFYNTGSGNVFLGYMAGSNETTGSNKLYIDNCFMTSGSPNYYCDKPLIYGDFYYREVQIDGKLTIVTLASPSDLRYKKEVKPLDSSLDKIMHLQGVAFQWDKDKVNGAGYKTGKQIGLIAQEVEKVLPELVQTDSKGYKTLSYDKLAPVIIEAMKEQQKTIKDQQVLLEEQKKTISVLVERLDKIEKMTQLKGTVARAELMK